MAGGEAGRPTIYSDELAEQICARIANGESLRSICRDPDMPERTTVYLWGIRDRDGFFNRYAQARLMQAQTLFDECIDIADDGSNDWMEKTLRSGETIEVVNHEHVSRSKLRVDTRLAMIKKLDPQRFGDKIQQEISGPDGGPIRVEDALAAGRTRAAKRGKPAS